ncbi:MAG: malonyl-ACP O-methyltransferase BioC [bacterium]
MLDKKEISRNFSASAKNYDQHAVLQKTLADKLLSQLPTPNSELVSILDLGCGTGYLIGKMKGLFPGASMIGLDIAPGMVEVASNKHEGCQLGDGEALPFTDDAFDLVVSNASLQWMDAGKVFSEVSRVLKPGGGFHFSTFGPETLKELKESGFRVNTFLSINELISLAKDKFAVVSFETIKVEQKFKTIKELLLHLKGIGAQTTDKSKSVNFSAFRKYQNKYGQDGFIPATYEIIFGHVIIP